MRIFSYFLISFLLGFAIYNSYELYQISKTENEIKYDHAEIRKIKYGLFNIDVWKEKIYGLIESKIGDFEISDDSYDVIRKQIELYLEELYEEYFVSGKLVESLMSDSDNNVGKIMMNLFKGGIEKQLEEIDFKSKIPSITNQLVLELKKKSPEIKRAISKQISDVLLEESGKTLVDQRTYYFKKYEQEDFESTQAVLNEKLDSLNKQSKEKQLYIIIPLCIALLLLLLFRKVLPFKTAMAYMTLISIVFLAMGLALPMIDLDARLASVDIQLMDEPIHFDEQVMYFQSKSIIDVTETVLESSAWDIKFVGFLILLFSIILPFSKMILSFLYLYYEKIRKSGFVKTVIFYLGKWSMADVFVVAIFMSYIGFYGLINSGIVDAGNTSSIETVNYTKLSPGIIFFTSYCLLSIIMSGIIHRYYSTRKE